MEQHLKHHQKRMKDELGRNAWFQSLNKLLDMQTQNKDNESKHEEDRSPFEFEYPFDVSFVLLLDHCFRSLQR